MTFGSAVLAAALTGATVVIMEAVATLSHRHIMHGPGWSWHRSHHQPRGGRLERNDLYALVFAAVAVVLFALGTRWWPLTFIGLGMTLYGVLYFLLHDILVHRRWPGFAWHPRRGYLRRIVQAHRLHHAVRERDGCVSFGFIWAPPLERLTLQLRARRMSRGKPAGQIVKRGTVSRRHDS